MKLGDVRGVFRYPVKSMLGETLGAAWLGEKGVPGDRAWAVRDEERGGINGAKKIPELMQCAARYVEEPGEGDAPAPEISLPDGSTFSASAADAGERIGRAVGREVTLWPLLPADALDHYRRGRPDSEDFMAELRALFGREPEEPLPDITTFPPELLEFESPPGTYFDAYPLLVMSEQSLETLAAVAPESKIDVRRFRPNLLVNSRDGGPYPEHTWVGQKVRIGEAVLAIEMACPRCVMTTVGFADLPKDPGVMRKLVRNANGELGVYAKVIEPGWVRMRDEIELLG